ncbi:MAG: GntR family transcriptional regulator [Lachnospiraceae bacterium]|nr:GntR family transcriptional regulator [Lachnospiraceae bacterium]
MEILISHKSSEPIYEQICGQIKDMVLTGELVPGDMITSVRVLAKELGIGVLTVQKAYDRLQQQGVIETVVGKGTYITAQNTAIFEDQKNQIVENKIIALIETAKKYEIKVDDLIKLVELLYDE